jgi:hypothetical protein
MLPADSCCTTPPEGGGLGLDEAFARFERQVNRCNVTCIVVGMVAAAVIARLG